MKSSSRRGLELPCSKEIPPRIDHSFAISVFRSKAKITLSSLPSSGCVFFSGLTPVASHPVLGAMLPPHSWVETTNTVILTVVNSEKQVLFVLKGVYLHEDWSAVCGRNVSYLESEGEINQRLAQTLGIEYTTMWNFLKKEKNTGALSEIHRTGHLNSLHRAGITV